MFNLSFMTCIRKYIGHKSLEDQTLSGWNGCLTPSHSVTQPSALSFWFSSSRLCLYLFWVECNQDNKSCKYLVDCNQDSKLCNFLIFQIRNFYSINEWNYSAMYFVISIFFLFFCINKNKLRLHTTYPKREVTQKVPESRF